MTHGLVVAVALIMIPVVSVSYGMAFVFNHGNQGYEVHTSGGQDVCLKLIVTSGDSGAILILKKWPGQKNIFVTVRFKLR
jgi:hypothetical protein